MQCDCAAKMDEALGANNTQLNLSFTLDGNVYFRVETIKIDKKKRRGPMAAIASYCPFCGVKQE